MTMTHDEIRQHAAEIASERARDVDLHRVGHLLRAARTAGWTRTHETNDQHLAWEWTRDGARLYLSSDGDGWAAIGLTYPRPGRSPLGLDAEIADLDHLTGILATYGLLPTPSVMAAEHLRGPWMAVLSDTDGTVYPTVAAAIENLGEEEEVEIAVVRGTAAPTDGERPGRHACGDAAYEIECYLIDPDDPSVGAEARYAQAQAMAAGLNAAAGSEDR